MLAANPQQGKPNAWAQVMTCWAGQVSALGVGGTAGQGLVNYQTSQNQQKGAALGGLGQGLGSLIGASKIPGKI